MHVPPSQSSAQTLGHVRPSDSRTAVAKGGPVDPLRDGALDRLTRLAARLLHAPMAGLSLLEPERLVVQHAYGLACDPLPLACTPEKSLSAGLAGSDSPLHLPEVLSHPVYRDRSAEFIHSIGAYLGIPICVGDRVAAAFWVADHSPHHWSPDEIEILQDLAEAAADVLRLSGPASIPALETESTDISTRKRAELERLTIQEQRRLVLAQIPCVLWSVDLDLRITSVHGRSLAEIGMLPGHTPGLSLYEYFRTEDADHPAIAGHRQALEGVPASYRVEVFGRQFEASVEPFRDANGRIVGALGVALDVTGKREADLAHKQSEALFRALVQNSSDVIAILNADGTTRYVSPSIGRVLGYRPEERMGRPAFEIIHPDDLPEVERIFERHLTQPQDLALKEFRVRDAHGGWRWFEAIARNRLSDPEIEGVVVNLRNITQRRAVEQDLRSVMMRAKCLLWHAEVEDRDGFVLSWRLRMADTEAAQRFLPIKMDPGETYADAWYRARLPDDTDRTNRFSSVEIRAGRSYTQAFRCRGANGEIHWLRESVDVEVVEPGRWRVVGVCTDITDQMRAESGLGKSEMRLRQLLETASVIPWEMDAETMALTYVGPQTVRILGHSQEKWKSSGFWQDHIHPEDLEAVARRNAEAIARGGEHELEFRILAADGRTVWLRDVLSVSHPPDGRVLLHGFSFDITQHKESEIALRASENHLRRSFECDMMGQFYWRLDGTILNANDRFLEMVGYTREDLEANRVDWRKLTPPEQLNQSLTIAARVLENGSCRPFEKEYIRKDGTRIPVLVGGAQFSNLEGVAFVLDIREQKRADQRNQAFQALGQMLNAAIAPEAAGRVILEIADRLIGWDSCWVSLNTGTGPDRTVVLMDELDGVRQDVTPSADPAVCSDFARQAQSEGAFIRLRSPEELQSLPQTLRPDGGTARPCASILCAPIRTAEKDIGALSIQSYDFNAYGNEDLKTLQALADYCAAALERTQAEAARSALEGQLLRSQKMEAIGRLAGGVAHDFNNMLAVINGYSEILQRQAEPESVLAQALQEIRCAGERAADLTRQLLAFSRKQLLEPRHVNLNEVIAATERLFSRLIGEDIELTTSLDPDLAPVRTDPSQVDQILMNLIVNARDAMPLGGKLTIETRNMMLDEAYVRTHADSQPGPHVLLAVTDTGSGMSREVQQRIFEPFFTTKEVGQGTGLGLPTVYGIVRQSGGWINVYSEVDVGTTFKIYLPRAADGQAAHPREEEIQCPRGTSRILLVEDEPMVRSMIQHLLESSGYTVIVAGSGPEALDAIHAGEPPDVVLTDVVMPGGMTGRELAEMVLARYPEVRVLYMSGYTDDAVVRHGLLAQNTHFLQKPFTPAALARKLQEVLA
jgi:two-component system, cell cycle sensor histidine kinase and response regulator CckA